MGISRKRQSKVDAQPVHGQAETHAEEHANRLKDGFLKDFLFAGHANSLQLHHCLGENAADRAANDSGNENEQLQQTAFFGRVLVRHGGCCCGDDDVVKFVVLVEE